MIFKVSQYSLFQQKVDEPRHDKTNEVNVRPAKTQISLGIRPILSYPLSAQLWSDWADAQSDLSLLGAQSLCWFCHVAAQIKYYMTYEKDI